MRFTIKITIFLIIFSLIFFFLHTADFYNNKVILADIGGIPWLYASIGTLFSILVGFVIQKEWENWNSLVDSVNGEVDTLREMWFWSRFLPSPTKDVFHDSVKIYLEEMSENGLYKSEQKILSNRIEESISKLNETLYFMFKNQPTDATSAFSFFSRLIEQRTHRIRYSSHHVPNSIKRIIFFTTILMVGLSMFIGVKNIWLDYTFTLSVSMIAFTLYLVIDDLDHPLTPGGWHLTSEPYKKLLEQISNKSFGIINTENKIPA